MVRRRHPHHRADQQGDTARRVLRSVLVVGLLASIIGAGTFAAFSSTTANTGNQFKSGTVVITDNDAGSAMFDLDGMTPTAPVATRCIVATYSGSVPSSVRLHGATTGTGLDEHLTVRITRGTIASPTFASCAGFTPDATNPRGLGAGVLYDGTLQAFPDGYADGVVDAATATPESWTTGETHAYRFDVTLADTEAAQGKEANQVFTWEARNQ